MITTTHLTTKKGTSTGNNQSFESLLGAHGIKSARVPRFIITMNPVACERWLRQVAACDQVVDGWILRDTAERFVYLNPLCEVWEKLQQFTQKQNFRVPEGYTYLLHRASLQQSVAMAPAQMLGLQLKDGQVTSVASLNVLPLNERPFRNIRVYPEDIVTSALQAMALLAGGFTCPVKMFHCLPDGLTPGQQRIIRNLFRSLSEIFTSSGFEVSLAAAPVSQFTEELAH